MLFILIATLAIAFGETIYFFLLLFNAYFNDYFVGVAFLFLLPLYVACYFFIRYFNKNTYEERAWLKWACLMVIGSAILVVIWQACYISSLYEGRYVYMGMGDKDDRWNYTIESKRDYITNAVLWGITVIVLYTYFFFACLSWSQLVQPEEKAETEKAE